MNPVDQLPVRDAGPADLSRVQHAFTTAFADEAVATWAEFDGQAEIYRDMVARALDQDEVIIAERGGHLIGVSVWIRMDSAERIYREVAELGAITVAQPGLTRLATAMRLVAERHPGAPHTFLPSIGVVPEARGRGVGGAILRDRLARADEKGQPVYLEASTPRSARLYARLGFEPLGEPIILPDSGPQIQPMWRDPREPTAQ